MSKITREEAKQKVTKLYEGIVYGKLTKGEAIKLENELHAFINQSPQLSDDVEMQLQHLEDTLENIEWWSDYEIVNEIRYHIQAQANEIKRLKESLHDSEVVKEETDE